MFGIKKKDLSFQGKRLYSIKEYLEIEKEVSETNEFWNEFVYKLETPNLYTDGFAELTKQIKKHLENTSNQVISNFFVKNKKVWLENENCLFYPDLFVVNLDKIEYYKNTKDIISNPIMIIEVSTIDSMAVSGDWSFLRDRKDKFWKYQKLSSLEEYILIADNGVETAIEIYNRLEDNVWKYRSFSKLTNQQVTFDSINFTFSVTDIKL